MPRPFLDLADEAQARYTRSEQMKFFPRDAGRPPNWRYHNAGEIAKRIVEDFRVRPSFPSDDKWASIAALFFYRMECARTARQQEVQAARRPDLFHAYSLYMSLARAAKALVFEVECRLLAGQTDDEIAEHTGLPPAAIGWYEALFFACVTVGRRPVGSTGCFAKNTDCWDVGRNLRSSFCATCMARGQSHFCCTAWTSPIVRRARTKPAVSLIAKLSATSIARRRWQTSGDFSIASDRSTRQNSG